MVQHKSLLRMTIHKARRLFKLPLVDEQSYTSYTSPEPRIALIPRLNAGPSRNPADSA